MSLIFYCKIPILCQSLAKSAQILPGMSDGTDTFRELCIKGSPCGIWYPHTLEFTISFSQEFVC